MVSTAARYGATNPELAPMQLVSPNREPANMGAMSMWLTRKPEYALPMIPTPSEIIATARIDWVQFRKARPTRKTAEPNIPEIKGKDILRKE